MEHSMREHETIKIKQKQLLVIENVEKYYGTKNSNICKALNNVSFSVGAGEFLGIMGPSGSGKTTLLNLISTIDTLSKGNIYLNEVNISNIKEKDMTSFRRKNLGFIFQDFNLLDTLTIHENIALALTINNSDIGIVDEKVKSIAQQLGISDILHKYPYEASGGEKQRCACGRAIINNPSLILADEPTGSLDSHSSKVLLESLQNMNQNMNATILMVTHDPYSASYANRILILKDGEIFCELLKGDKSRKQFLDEIHNVLADMGGNQ